MKLPNGLDEGVAAAPDYQMLRAALAVIQAGTPTARRAAAAPAPTDRPAAWNALVTGDAAGFGAAAAALGHCFALPAGQGGTGVNEDERALYRGVSAFLEPVRVDPRATMRRAQWLGPRAADRG